MNTPTTFICPYCGGTRDRAAQSLEHPLARAIGGRRFSRHTFCDPCNKRAGREVDRPFVEHSAMLALGHRFSVRDEHGTVPPAPRLRGKDDGGDPVFLELGSAPRVRRIPHKTRDDERGRSYRVEPGEAEAFAEKIKARLEKQYGDSARIEASIESVEAGENASIPVGLPLKLWPRFAAKLGLAFGREAFGNDWLLSEGAAQLRRVLWDTDDAPGLPPSGNR